MQLQKLLFKIAYYSCYELFKVIYQRISDVGCLLYVLLIVTVTAQCI